MEDFELDEGILLRERIINSILDSPLLGLEEVNTVDKVIDVASKLSKFIIDGK